MVARLDEISPAIWATLLLLRHRSVVRKSVLAARLFTALPLICG